MKTLQNRYRLWQLKPKYRRAADLARLMLVFLMFSGAIPIAFVTEPTGFLKVMVETIPVLTPQVYAMMLVVFGILTLILPRPRTLGMVFQTIPILLYIIFGLVGAMRGEYPAHGLIIIGLLYGILFVLYWGATE